MTDASHKIRRVEVAAGAGLPSLVAARAGSTFGRVVATDFTEEGVQLLAANDERNGSRLAGTARLDLTEDGAAVSLTSAAAPAAIETEVPSKLEGGAPADLRSPARAPST